MRVIDCLQGSEEWERWRARPTASEFSSFITPARGQLSAQATKYAAKIVTKRMGAYTEPVPTAAMEWGTEHEPIARAEYVAHTGNEVEEVGFILPDATDSYGGSPDGLVGDDGLLEIKCPAAEQVVFYRHSKVLPLEYKPQVQGLLMISGRPWCDFFAWHPLVPEPFLLRVFADHEYQTKIAECLLLLLKTVDEIEREMGLNDF